MNRLRKQVASEVKRRRLILLTLFLLSIVYLLVNVLFGDMGVLRYRELRGKKQNIETEIRRLEAENERIRSEIKLIKEDPYVREKHAREDYGLAKPDDIIIEYDNR